MSLIHCCFWTTSCYWTMTACIILYSCNYDCEHIMIICVDSCFNNIACQISWFHEFNQFVSYVVLIIWIWASCHTCSSDHEYTVQHIQHVYQIVTLLWQDVWFM